MSILSALILATPLVAVQPVVIENPQNGPMVEAISEPISRPMLLASVSNPVVVLAQSVSTQDVQAEINNQASETLEAAPITATTQTEQQTDAEPIPEGNEIIVTGDYGAPKEDPLMRLNEAAFDLTNNVDQAVVGPIAFAYEEALPSPLRTASINFLRNLREPTNFINFLLQFKIGKAIETLGRFTINSTLGLGGIIDIAGLEGVGLPYRRTGFSDTMGFYGIGDGPFLVIPLVGSTTLRDLIGSGLDQAVLPFAVGKPFDTPAYGIPAYALNSLNFRLEFDEQLTDIRNSDDPYVELREEYLAKRHYEIDLLKSGDQKAGIPGAYLEYKRSQTAAEEAAKASPSAPVETASEPVIADPAPASIAPAPAQTVPTPAPENPKPDQSAVTFTPYINPQTDVLLTEKAG